MVGARGGIGAPREAALQNCLEAGLHTLTDEFGQQPVTENGRITDVLICHSGIHNACDL
jgi:hypothetical protein